MVSPANSFGLMDGGIDYYISEFFGWQLLPKVQQAVLDEWCGEQPVGTCMMVPTGNEKHPWLLTVPQ